MRLYIMRHGIAFEQHEWAASDSSRPLTEQGKIRTRDVIATLNKKDKLEVDAIWSSPLVRARETAEIAGEVLGLPVKIVDDLASGTNLSALIKAFKNRQPLPERLMLVGHEPDCGEIIGGLIGDLGGDYALKKAGIAALKGEFEKGKMELKWKLDPKDVLEA